VLITGPITGHDPALQFAQPVVQRPDALKDQRALGVAPAVM